MSIQSANKQSYIFDFEDLVLGALDDFPDALADTVFLETKNIRYFDGSFADFTFHAGTTLIRPRDYLEALDTAGFRTQLAEQLNKKLHDLTLAEMREIEPLITPDIYACLDVNDVVRSRQKDL